MKNEIRTHWKNACKWSRYQGYNHGMPGGISIAPQVAMDGVDAMRKLGISRMSMQSIDHLEHRQPGWVVAYASVFGGFFQRPVPMVFAKVNLP